MRITLSVKDFILSLLEKVKEKKERAGDPWSDSKAAQLCFGHGEYVGNLRRWTGGKGSPTLEKTAQFEGFLKDQLSDEEYEAVVSAHARALIGDDFD